MRYMTVIYFFMQLVLFLILLVIPVYIYSFLCKKFKKDTTSNEDQNEYLNDQNKSIKERVFDNPDDV